MSTQLASDPHYRPPGSNPARPTSSFYSFIPTQTWAPAINLYETARAYIVCVDLAGVDKEKIDVELTDNVLTLSGHRAVPSDFDPEGVTAEVSPGGAARRSKVHVMEIDHGQFSRTVELPTDADRDAITARYRNGLLWVDVPKKSGQA